MMLQLASKQTVGTEMKGLRLYILTFKPVLETSGVCAYTSLEVNASVARQAGTEGFKQRASGPARLLGSTR